MTTVGFYYSIGSRYSYLAATQISTLENDTGCRVDWYPIDSHALLSRRGRDPFAGQAVSRQYEWDYRELDAKRWASLYSVPFVEPRGRVSFDARTLALAATAAKRIGVIASYSLELFSAMFADGAVRLIDRAECVRRAQRCSVGEPEFARELESAGTAAELDATVDKAFSLGVFGVPTFVVGVELFWGNDRIVLLRDHLARREN